MLHVPSMTYRQIRLSWCRDCLLRYLRRWSGYIVAAVLVLGTASTNSVATLATLATLPALPMFWACEQGIWIVALVLGGYAAAGCALCWAMRPALWPADWCDIEAALPIPSRDRLISDTLVSLLCLAPFHAVLGAALLAWLWQSPEPAGSAIWPGTALFLSCLLSTVGAVCLLLAMRHRGRHSASLGASSAKPISAMASARAVFTFAPAMSLVILPILRQPARRSCVLLMLAVTLIVVPAILAVHPAWLAWGMALQATVLLLLTSRLNAVLESDLAPLHAACLHLPIAAPWLLRQRRLVGAAPLLISTLSLLTMLIWVGPMLRTLVVASYLLAAATTNLWQIYCASSPSIWYRQMAPANRASAWLVLLILQISLASEIIKP